MPPTLSRHRSTIADHGGHATAYIGTEVGDRGNLPAKKAAAPLQRIMVGNQAPCPL